MTGKLGCDFAFVSLTYLCEVQVGSPQMSRESVDLPSQYHYQTHP